MAPNRDDSLRGARNLGLLPQGSLKNRIGFSDSEDLFRFRIQQSSQFSASLSGITSRSRLSLQLFQARGSLNQLLQKAGKQPFSQLKFGQRRGLQLLQSGVSPGAQPITQPLSSGIYFLRVARRSGQSYYRLTTATLPAISSPATVLAAPAPTPTPAPARPPYSSLFGYGLVNASAAVARTLGQPAFAEVANSLNPRRQSLDQLNAPEAWAQGYRGQGVVVAVLDTGADYSSSFLSDSLWRNPGEIAFDGVDNDSNGYIDDDIGWNFVSNNNDPNDNSTNGHGTFVAGVITDRDFGVAPEAQVMLLKTASADGFSVPDDRVADAVYYAVQNGAKIINLSFGGLAAPTLRLRQAMQFARQQGVLFVAAAGNERQSGAFQPLNPALYAATNNLGLVAGAVDSTNRLASFSNPAGRQMLDYLVAPGVNIYSTAVNSGLPSEASGTSFAAPAIAGVAALMLSANPSLTADQIEQILIETTNPNLRA